MNVFIFQWFMLYFKSIKRERVHSNSLEFMLCLDLSLCDCTRSAHEMATFMKLPSGNWRAQVRRKGRYAAETFRRKKDAETWALEVERRFDRGEELLAKRPPWCAPSGISSTFTSRISSTRSGESTRSKVRAP